MRSRRVKTNQLAKAVMRELESYRQEITDQIKDDIKTVAKEMIKKIKLKAPKKTGQYRKGWRYRIVHESDTDLRVVIYNSERPQLTHLLEFGHGGPVRSKAYPHIRPAKEYAEKELVDKAKVAVKKT